MTTLSSLRRASIGALLVVLIAAPATAAPGDDAILAAADAFRVKNRAKFASAAAGAQGHILEPYVQGWGYQLALEETSPAELLEFLNKYPRTTFGDRLRADWIRSLVRRGEWATVREQTPQLVDASPDLTCWGLQARWRLQDALAIAEARALWDQPRAIPEGCVPLIDQLVRAGDLTQRQVWQRGRTGHGLYRYAV